MIGLPRDYFDQAITMSIVKFFQNDATLDYMGTAFNAQYPIVVAYRKLDLDEMIANASNKGVMSVELYDEFTYKRNDGRPAQAIEYDRNVPFDQVDLVEYGRGTEIIFSVGLRLFTNEDDNRSKHGLSDMADFRALVEKIMEADCRIPVLDFRADPVDGTATDIYISYQFNMNDYTKIITGPQKKQESIMTVPCSCRFYEVVSAEAVHKSKLDPSLPTDV